jgi:hypothetical protein
VEEIKNWEKERKGEVEIKMRRTVVRWRREIKITSKGRKKQEKIDVIIIS